MISYVSIHNSPKTRAYALAEKQTYATRYALVMFASIIGIDGLCRQYIAAECSSDLYNSYHN